MRIWRSIISAFVVTTLLFGVHKLTVGNDLKIDANVIVKKMTAEVKVPSMIDSETRIDSVTAQGSTIVVKYTLVNFDKFDLPRGFKNMMQTQVNRMFCQRFMANPDFGYVMKQSHVDFTFKYYNATGLILQDFNLKPEQCGA